MKVIEDFIPELYNTIVQYRTYLISCDIQHEHPTTEEKEVMHDIATEIIFTEDYIKAAPSLLLTLSKNIYYQHGYQSNNAAKLILESSESVASNASLPYNEVKIVLKVLLETQLPRLPLPPATLSLEDKKTFLSFWLAEFCQNTQAQLKQEASVQVAAQQASQVQVTAQPSDPATPDSPPLTADLLLAYSLLCALQDNHEQSEQCKNIRRAHLKDRENLKALQEELAKKDNIIATLLASMRQLIQSDKDETIRGLQNQVAELSKTTEELTKRNDELLKQKNIWEERADRANSYLFALRKQRSRRSLAPSELFSSARVTAAPNSLATPLAAQTLLVTLPTGTTDLNTTAQAIASLAAGRSGTPEASALVGEVSELLAPSAPAAVVVTATAETVTTTVAQAQIMQQPSSDNQASNEEFAIPSTSPTPSHHS
ncbi:MAG: hypothetical protein K0S08_143 [Gammaproteobacteria bacterium]|jgi:hypothetical protein|nr:hypothetical protein [Gammaproteobacteria bacterium]